MSVTSVAAKRGASRFGGPSSTDELQVLGRPLGAVVAAVALSIFVPPAGPFLYGVLALHALRGARQTVEALTLLVLILLGNPLIRPEGSLSLRWVVIFAGFGRMLWDTFAQGGARAIGPTRLLGALGVFLAWSALRSTFSALPLLSFLKLTAFGIGTITVLVSFYRTRQQGTYWRSWLFTISVFIVAGSFVIYALGLGFWRTSEGFQGVFSHPQILGPVAAVVAAWLFGRYLEGRGEWGLIQLGVMGGALGLVYLSWARTGLFAFVLGFLVVAAEGLFGGGNYKQGGRSKALNITILIVILVTSMVAYGPKIQKEISDFITKSESSRYQAQKYRGDQQNLLEESRGMLIRRSMANFYESPWIGIGFGMPSIVDRYFLRSVERLAGIPVGASVEKGFMPSAMLEEVGLIGTAMMLVFLALVWGTVFQGGGLGLRWAFWTTILLNGGEAAFFSIGGIGLFMWLMIGFCVAQAEAQKEAFVGASTRKHAT